MESKRFNKKPNMQSKEIKTIDARTFPEIWESLSSVDRETLQYKLINALHCTRQTIWNYSKGNTTPTHIVKKEVASVVSKMTGTKCHPNYLFP